MTAGWANEQPLIPVGTRVRTEEIAASLVAHDLDIFSKETELCSFEVDGVALKGSFVLPLEIGFSLTLCGSSC